MKVYKMITAVAVAMLALTAMAQPVAMTVEDEEQGQIVTVRAVGDDIVRVEVVPFGWTGQYLPSLALDRTPKGKVKIDNGDDISMLRTDGGM